MTEFDRQAHASASERSTQRATWVQAVAALLALLVAAPALWLSWRTLSDQQKINASQTTVNRLELEREERRYASRVAWWQRTPTPWLPLNSGDTLVVQNRSTTPMQETYLHVTIQYSTNSRNKAMEIIGGMRRDGKKPPIPTLPIEDDLLLPDIPPCSLLTATMPLSTYWDVLGNEFSDWSVDYSIDYLSFTESARRWQKTSSSLTKDARVAQPSRIKASNGTLKDRARVELNRRIFFTSVKENPATDCSGDV